MTCQQCGHRVTEMMFTLPCWFLYECSGCGKLWRPQFGDCCV
nr:GDCCVxC domain-containing (seleno)protein [Rhodanobacter sp. Root561]